MAEHFEAKKHAYRQTQDGIVISFVCHPNDVAQALALAPLGTRYMVAVAEIGDNEKHVGGEVARKSQAGNLSVENVEGARPSAQTKERKPFDSLPLSQQAAIRCGDADFQRFMVEHYAGPLPYLPNADNAAIMVRDYCDVASRADLNTIRGRGEKWLQIEAHYQSWLTTERYGSIVR